MWIIREIKTFLKWLKQPHYKIVKGESTKIVD